MSVIRTNAKHTKLLARLMRAEAEGEGALGMLMVGNVGVNRVRCNCMDFKRIANIQDMVFQSPGGFESTTKGYFYQKARQRDIRLAKKSINGKRYWPGSYALWFFDPTGSCPSKWFNQPLADNYKSHCFYAPSGDDCPGVYSTY